MQCSKIIYIYIYRCEDKDSPKRTLQNFEKKRTTKGTAIHIIILYTQDFKRERKEKEKVKHKRSWPCSLVPFATNMDS